MVCDAIKMEFEVCPNPAAVHFDGSALGHTIHYETPAQDVFAEDLETLAQMVQRRVDPKAVSVIETLIHLLYEVEVDEQRNEDGGLDAVSAYGTLVGAFDLPTLAKALRHE